MRQYLKENVKRIPEIIFIALTLIVEYFISLVVVLQISGTILVYFDLTWRWKTIIPILFVAVTATFILHRLKLFLIENGKEFFLILLILIVGWLLYSQYSPMLEIRQDPSLYMYRALNLINYGHVYQPMEGYADMTGQADDVWALYGKIQNGTYINEGKLYTDFYPGGSFIYALIGKVNKPFVFYGQTFIMLLVSWLLYFVIKSILKRKDEILTVACTLLFIISPLIVWFGRGSYTEPIALFFFLLLTLLFTKLNLKSTVNCLCLMTASAAAYTARIDYIILLIIGAFIISYMNAKMGVIYSVFVLLSVYLVKKAFAFYFVRISVDLSMVRYGDLLLCIATVIGILLSRFGKKSFEAIYYSKMLRFVAIIIGTLLICLMFYDNIAEISGYSYAIIHEQYMRTWNESILDLLFLVFPSIVIVGGLYGMHTFLDRRYELPISAFICGSVLVYSYLFFGADNSPQLYWILRRYMNVLLPGILLGFASLIQYSEKKLRWFLCCAAMMLSGNLLWNSNQIVNYQNLDRETVKLEEILREEGYSTIYYTSDKKYEVSPLFSYSNMEMIPVFDDDIQFFLNYIKNTDTSQAVLITGKDVGLEAQEIYTLDYLTMGENYGKIPEEVYEHHTKISVYPISELREFPVLFPGIYTKNTEGLYDDGWTNGWSKFEVYVNCSDWSGLVVEMRDYDNYWLQQGKDNFDIKLIINGRRMLIPSKIQDNKIYFDIRLLKEKIREIKILCPTFNPQSLGLGEDSRNLGINVNRIYFN